MVSKNLAMAREAIRAFNMSWLDALGGMLAPGATYVDEPRGITATGPEALQHAGELRRALAGELKEPHFEGAGNVVVACASVTEPGDFVEVLEFDDQGKILRITTRYGDLALVEAFKKESPRV